MYEENQNSPYQGAQYSAGAQISGQTSQYRGGGQESGQNAPYQSGMQQFGQNAQYQADAQQFGQNTQYQADAQQPGQNAQYQADAQQPGQNAQYQSGTQQFGQTSQYQGGQQWQGSGVRYENMSSPHYDSASHHENKTSHHRNGHFGKIMMAVCMGLLFGLFAGAGFYAVQLVTGLPGNENTQNAVQSSVADKEETDGNNPLTSNALSSGQDTYLRVLTTEESDITEVVEQTMPSMVSITETYTVSTTYWGQTYTQEGDASGSGIIIGETDDEYIIVTNYHVIEDADEMTVTFINDEEVEAHLKGADATVDIAVISVLKDDLSEDTLDTISVAELGDSDSLVLGQNVIAIGNALGYGQSVTTGIVSAINREITTQSGYTYYCIQTDAAINPGNSGGALLNMAGQVIGINQSKSGGSAVEGMGYAIPISSVRDVIDDLMGRDTLIMVDEDNMGYIGIYMQEVTPEISAYYNIPQGVYVSELVPGGGAEKAGILAGDIIIGIDGNKALTNDGMKRLLKYYAVGEDVDITFLRNENGEYVEHTVTVTLGSKPARSK